MSKGASSGSSGGFFSKLFGRSNNNNNNAANDKNNAAAQQSSASGIGSMEERAIVNRARSSAHLHGVAGSTSNRGPTSSSSSASQDAHHWREFRFPSTLAGDKLEGLWRAHQLKSLPTSDADLKSLLEGLKSVETDWKLESSVAAQGHRNVHETATTTADQYTSPPSLTSVPLHASSSSAAYPSLSLSSLPPIESYHRAHGHPSSFLRRLVQDFTQHTANILPDQLATFIATHSASSSLSPTSNPDSSLGLGAESPELPSPSSSNGNSSHRTLEQLLERSPMYLLLAIMQHLLQFTNNRQIMQHTEFFTWLIKLAQMLANEYLTLPSPPPAVTSASANSSPFFNTSLLTHYFHTMLQRCFSMIQLWMDGSQAWRRRELYTLSSIGSTSSKSHSSGGFEGHSPSHANMSASAAAAAASSAFGNLCPLPPMTPIISFPISPLDQSTLTDTAIQLFVHLHPHLIQYLHAPAIPNVAPAGATGSTPSIIPSFFPLPLYHSLLHLFGCLSHCQPTQQEIFLQHSLHRRLIEVIGFKGQVQTDDEQGEEKQQEETEASNTAPVSPSTSFPPFTLTNLNVSPFNTPSAVRDAWFVTQFTCLEVLREMCFAQQALLLEFVKNGGIDRILDALLWTYSAFHAVDSNAAPTVSQSELLHSITMFLNAEVEEERRELDAEEELSQELSSTRGGWMKSAFALLLRSERNPRCNTIFASDRALLPSILVRSSPQLLAVFNVLLSMCCMDIYPSEHTFHPFTSPASTGGVAGAAATASGSKSKPLSPSSAAASSFNISFLILQMILDVFNGEINPTPQNQTVRAQLLQLKPTASGLASPNDMFDSIQLPFLQLHTITFFQQLLLYKPSLLGFVRTYNVYHTLFSPAFFFFGQQASEELGTSSVGSGYYVQIEGASPMPNRTPAPTNTSDAQRILIAKLLRSSVLQLMSYFATLHAKPATPEVRSAAVQTSNLSVPAAELSYLFSLLYQRYTNSSLVSQVCQTLKRIWQHRRAECESALQHLCWQAHLFNLHSPDTASARVAAGMSPSPIAQVRPIDPFKVFSKQLSFFHQSTLPNSPSTGPQRAFLSLLETVIFSSLEMQVLSLREHAFVWGAFTMVEYLDAARRRSGIRITMALVCAVGASADILPTLATPPQSANTGILPAAMPEFPPAPATPAGTPNLNTPASRNRAHSTEVDTGDGITVTNHDVTLLSKKEPNASTHGGSSLYDHDEVQKVARVLLTKYIELFPAHCTPSLAILIDLTYGLHGLLTRHSRLHQDLCRRRHIFVQLMHILSHLGNASLIVEEDHLGTSASTVGQQTPMNDSFNSNPISSRGDRDPNTLTVSASFTTKHIPGSSKSRPDSPTEDGKLTVDDDSEQQVLSVRTHSSPSAIIHTQSAAEPSRGAGPVPQGLSMPLMQRSISDSVVVRVAAPRLSSALTLLLSLLRCLTLLLAGNQRSKEVFRKNIGIELLAKLIQKVVSRECGIVEDPFEHGRSVRRQSSLNNVSSAAQLYSDKEATPIALASRAIYGEVFRALVEREWSEIDQFESGTIAPFISGNHGEQHHTSNSSVSSGASMDLSAVAAVAVQAKPGKRLLPQRTFLFNASTDSKLIDALLPQVLALQRTMLVHRLLPNTAGNASSVSSPLDDAVQSHGFLIAEHSLKQLRSFLFEEGGEILAVFAPSESGEKIRDSVFAANPSAANLQVTGSGGFPLVAYVMLSHVSDFEAEVNSNTVAFELMVSKPEWSEFINNYRDQKRHIKQIACAADSRGAGVVLLNGAKARYPRGLLACVVAGPQPLINNHALSFFHQGKFKQIGMETVKAGLSNPYPSLRSGFKSQVLTWNSEADQETKPGEEKEAAGRQRGGSLLASNASQIIPAVPENKFDSAASNLAGVSSGPYAGDTSFVWIQNPDIIPLVFSPQLFLVAPLAVQRDVLAVFTRLIVTSFLNQSHCCKVLLIDLLLDLFPYLPPLTQHSDELVSLQRNFLFLIQVIGTHSISVKQLKRFFSLMKSIPLKVPQDWLRVNAASSTSAAAREESANQMLLTPTRQGSDMSSAASELLSPVSNGGDEQEYCNPTLIEVQVRPWYGPLLLGAIEAMTSKCGPDHFWFLDGLSSGLTIPPLDRWPNKAGWGFSAWIRIESYVQPSIPQSVTSDAALAEFVEGNATNDATSYSSAGTRIGSYSYQPRLFHFSAASNGPYIEAFFNSARHLTIAVCQTAGGPVQMQSIDYDLQPQTWYHVCVSQNVPATFGSSELNVYIDASCVHTSNALKYPNISKQLSFCFVGTNQASNPLGTLQSSPATVPLPSTSAAPIQALYGQLGPFYFFDDILTPLQVQLMYALGPSYMFTFGPETISVNAQSKTIGSQGLDTMVPAAVTTPPPPMASQGRRGSTSASSGNIPTATLTANAAVAAAQSSAANTVTMTSSIASHARNLSAKIFLAYNARARDGHLFLDNTPRSKRLNSNTTVTSRKRGMHAVALVGTHQCSTRHVAHVLTCLGGVSVLFPLLAQLDQPIHRLNGPMRDRFGSANGSPNNTAPDISREAWEDEANVTSPPASLPSSPERAMGRSIQLPTPMSPSGLAPSSTSIAASRTSELVYEVDRRFLVNFLHVMYVMMQKEVNQSYMLSIHGFSVIASQLELASPKHFTIKTVQALHKLMHGVKNNDQLFKHAFVAFFTNLKLWIYVKPPVQKYWLCIVQEFVSNYPFLLNQSLNLNTMNSLSPLLGKGTQHLLDRLRAVCWFQQHMDERSSWSSGSSMFHLGSASSAQRSFILHPVTQQIIGMRPSNANLKEIRSDLLQMLYKTLSIPPIGVSFPDIKALVYFLQCCGGSCLGSGGVGGALGDESQIDDVLWILIQLLENQSVVVLKYLSELDDLGFLQLQGNTNSSTSASTTPAMTPSQSAAAASIDKTTAVLVDAIITTSPSLASSLPTKSKYQYDALKRAGMDIFLDLLYSTSSVRVRALSLRGLAKLLRSGSINSPSLQAEMFLIIEYALCGGLDGGRVVKPYAQPFLLEMAVAGQSTGHLDQKYMTHAPRKREWDESIYLALLSLMLGVHIDTENIREIRTTLLLEGTTILHTQPLSILFKLCAFHAQHCICGPPLLEIILQDMMFLLNHTTINMKLMMDQYGWQEWMCEIISQDKLTKPTSEYNSTNCESTTPTVNVQSPTRNSILASFDAVSAQHSVDDSVLPTHHAVPPVGTASHASPPAHARASSLVDSQNVITSTPSGRVASVLGGVNADASSAFPTPELKASNDNSNAANSGSRPPMAVPPLSPSPSEHLQSSINAQSYATSLFEQLLIHSLKKPNGWKHYDRMIVYLCFYMHPPSTNEYPSTGAHHAALRPRMDLPVLAFLVPLLQDLSQLLRREAETIPPLELGLLVENMIHVLDRTQDVLLERISLHARIQSSGATLSELARREFECVWTILEIMLNINAWLALFKPAHVLYREKEREKEYARRGYLGILGSAAVGVVKGAAGAVSSATTATYRAIHDAFDLVGEPNVITTPAPNSPTTPDEPLCVENEALYFAQCLLRIFMCFEDSGDRQSNPPSAVSSPTAGNRAAEGSPSAARSYYSISECLFHSDGGLQVTQILSFLMTHDRPYATKLSAAFRKSAAVTAAQPGAMPTTAAQSSSAVAPVPSPSPLTSPNANRAALASPTSPSPSSNSPEADLLLYLYTSFATILDSVDEAAIAVEGDSRATLPPPVLADEPGSHAAPGDAQASVTPFLLLVASFIRTLYAASAPLSPPNAVTGAEPSADANSASTMPAGITPFIAPPVYPSAAYLPALPAAQSPMDDEPVTIQALKSSAEWVNALNSIRPLVHPLQGMEQFAQAGRLSSLHRLAARTRESHLKLVLGDQWGVFAEGLSLVSALSARHGAAETARYNSMLVKKQRVARRRFGTWKWMLRSLTNERGPWSSAPSSSNTEGESSSKKVYWKLDETESSSRMRRKLKVNYRGHDHKEAAHDYIADKNNSSALKSPDGTSNGPKEEDLFAAAVLFSKSAMGVLSPECQDTRAGGSASVALQEEDWELMEKGKGGKEDSKGKAVPVIAAGEIVFDTDCTLMHLLESVNGRLRASSTHLLFEAKDETSSERAEKDRKRRKRRGGVQLTSVENINHDRSWLISHVVAIHFRRHQLRRNAVEIFFQDHTCVFFVFQNETQRNLIHSKLLRALRPFARLQQSKLGSAGGIVSPLAFMGFVYAGSSGNYGIGGPWGGNAFDVIRKSGLVTAWRTRRISNFEYLMHLNTIAGRSYNDLSQYPVFPWVLTDYTSQTINLDDPKNESGVFRDLTKPVGALNPNRLKMFLDRYHSLDDPSMPAFMYGTHYSSSGTVLHYLMRLEPFTTAAVELQDGKFDHSDRLFHSIPATWEGVYNNAADVKELIPEFFYLPQMFTNDAKINFGTKQKGEKINDVVLPPWASSPEEFVRINRAALESEYVSLNLHHWIDLIFGFKQQGRAALEANNVFFHLTYEGAVDVDRIEDPVARLALRSQIEHFGQTPSQLFSNGHPHRINLQEHREQEIPSFFQQMRELQKLQSQALMLAANPQLAVSPSSTDVAMEHSRLMLQLYTVEQVTAPAATENPLLFLALLPNTDRLLSLGLDRIMSLHKFKNVIQEYIPPFQLEVDKRKGSVSGNSTSSGSGSSGTGSSSLVGALISIGGSKGSGGSGKRVGVHFTVGLNILPFFFLVSHDERYLLSCGHWDNSLRITHIESGSNIQSISAHKDIVTCMAISEVGDFIVTGSKDTTTCVWQVADYVIDMASHPTFQQQGAIGASAAAAAVSASNSGDLYLLDQPMHVLYGHDDEVTCVACSSDLDVVVSGSRDGTVMIHSLRSGRYVRTISPPEQGCIRWVGVSSQGTILTYSLLDLMLHAYSINGKPLGSCDTGERLYCLQFSQDGEFLLAGGDRKQLTIYQVQPLQPIHRLPPTDATIRSLAVTKEEQHLLVGTGTGKLYVYGLNADYLRKRFLKRLAHLGL